MHINPSLFLNSIFRDSIFVIISKLFRKKVLIQWHGWNPKNKKLINIFILCLFRISFFQADKTKFLYSKLVCDYKKLGYNNELSLGKTFVDYSNFQVSCKPNKTNIQFLFLSAISKNKGIYEAIDLFLKLSIKFKNISLKIAGDGIEFGNVKRLIKNYSNIEMLGHVSGEEKSKLLNDSDIVISL